MIEFYPMEKYTEKLLELNERKYILVGIVLVASLVLSIIGWASFVKVDAHVPASGKITVKTYRKPIKYKEWANVRKIFIKEGQYINKGDPLLEVEDLTKFSNYEINFKNYYELLALRDRLISEKKGLNKVIFSREFLSLKNEELKKNIINTQVEVFNKRRQKYLNQLSVVEEKIHQEKEQLKGYFEVLEVKRKLLYTYIKQIENYESLVKEGLIPKLRLEDLRIQKQKLEIEIEDLTFRAAKTQILIRELEKQKNLIKKEYLKEVAENLQEVLFDLESVKTKLKYSKQEIRKAIIRAPVSGQVIGLKLTSTGEVIKPGEVLMYIVPREDELMITAKLSPQDRDKVKEGMLVDLKFPSFLGIGANFVEGKVVYVASDTLVDEINKYEYYEIHIVLTQKGKTQLKKYGFSLIPGMPAIAFIRVERITPVEYFLQPVLVMLKSAFKSN